MTKKSYKYSDPEFRYVLKEDPTLEMWRELASEWMEQQHRSRPHSAEAIDRFLVRYISKLNLERNPIAFLSRTYQVPDLGCALKLNSNNGIRYNNILSEFLDWILTEKIAITDELGRSFIPAEFRNPISRRMQIPKAQSETFKTPLPFRYIRQLREMIAPGNHFRNWTWAHHAIETGTRGGDWFVVEPELIDIDDPDCVWRTREVVRKGEPVEIFELWSPVRAMVIYIKLELPLRTFQVRMLDSGEADTWRYINRQWHKNLTNLANGSEKRPTDRGVFHRNIDPETQKTHTGLYINTNKTGDINNEELAPGYVIPWENAPVLYWLEKLRNWQEKYNPIREPTQWLNFEGRHFGRLPPHKTILAARGSGCFLFRHAAASNVDDRDKPIAKSLVLTIWYGLLKALEEKCRKSNETLDDGSPILFVNPKSRFTTLYPLHSLRVSLITAFALDGAVPFVVLSKLIVGHSRLVMTLHYTKLGKAYMTNIMREAERNLVNSDEASYRRFVAEASYQQIEESFALNDNIAALAATQQSSAASSILFDKGICPMGCSGCDIGMANSSLDSSRITYGPVPGFPLEKNCVRCRFFMTGPQHLPGLIAHFNQISYELSECSELYVRLEQEFDALEDQRAAAEEQNQPFSRSDEFDCLSRHLEQETQKVDKLANDLHATLRLIDRCTALLDSAIQDGIKLVPNGGVTDVRFALTEVASETHQLEVICENAVLFPENDASKATLRRSQILDAMFEMNGQPPVLFKLSPAEQLKVGNHLMQFIQLQTGGLENAVEVAEGRVLLKEIGLLEKAQELVEQANAISLLEMSKPKPRANF